jgi:uncharacterized protein YaeQ
MGKFSFHLESQDRKRLLPAKVIVGQRDQESSRHVILKLLSYLVFYRERLHIEHQLHNDNIPFEPDLVELDYELQPVFWCECGDCGVPKLDRLAVKVPAAEIWVIKGCHSEAEQLFHAVQKAELRKNRYTIVGLEGEMVEELCSLLKPRNQVFWVAGGFEPPLLQFDFNGLWFDTSFAVWRH